MKGSNIRNFLIKICPYSLKIYWERVEKSVIGSRLAKGVFWSMTGTIVSRGLILIATILVARILGKTAYGELGMIQSTVGMFGTFAGFGLGLTATKHVAEFRKSDPLRAGRIIGISGLFAFISGGLMLFILIWFAPWLAEHTINAPHLSSSLRIGSLILFFSAINGAQTGTLSGLEAFKTIALVNLFVGLLSFPIIVFGAYSGDLKGVLWAIAVTHIFHWFLNHIALRKETLQNHIPLSLENCLLEKSILWKFSLPAVLAGSMVGPVTWFCHALLANQPNGYGELGLFNAANQWYLLMIFVPGIVGSVILPVMSDQLGQNKKIQSMRTLILAIKINSIVVLPPIFLICVVSPQIMNLYGESFRSGWTTMVIVLITAGIQAVQTPLGQMIAASGRMWLGFSMNAGWALVFIASTILLVDNGSIGLASARLVSYIAHSIWTCGFAVWLFRKHKFPEESST